MKQSCAFEYGYPKFYKISLGHIAKPKENPWTATNSLKLDLEDTSEYAAGILRLTFTLYGF